MNCLGVFVILSFVVVGCLVLEFDVDLVEDSNMVEVEVDVLIEWLFIKNVYFGDFYVYIKNSFDVYIFVICWILDDVYCFVKGEKIFYDVGYEI